MNYRNRSDAYLNSDIILASIGRRFWAYFLDWLFIVMLYFCVLFILSLFKVKITKIEADSVFDVKMEGENIGKYGYIILKLVLGFLPVLYFSLQFYFFKGYTLGKRIFRIRVASLYHPRPGFWHCIERSLGYFASAVECGFGFIQAYWNPNRMSLHDKIGETVVICVPRKKMVPEQNQ